MAADAAAGVAGIVLAGGLSRRMQGGDKALRPLGGQTLIGRVIDRLAPQVGALAINANGDPARFAALGRPVVADAVGGFAGPLAGVLTGMEWAAAAAPDCRWLVTVPCDAPLIPADLVARLVAAVAEEGAEEGAAMACAASQGRDHPVVGLWPVALRQALRDALVDEEIRKVDRWTARYRLARAEFVADPIDPFFNVNTPDDAALAERLLGQARRG